MRGGLVAMEIQCIVSLQGSSQGCWKVLEGKPLMDPYKHPWDSQLSTLARPRQHKATKNILPLPSPFLKESMSASGKERRKCSRRGDADHWPPDSSTRASCRLELSSRMRKPVFVNIFLNQECIFHLVIARLLPEEGDAGIFTKVRGRPLPVK